MSGFIPSGLRALNKGSFSSAWPGSTGIIHLSASEADVSTNAKLSSLMSGPMTEKCISLHLLSIV